MTNSGREQLEQFEIIGHFPFAYGCQERRPFHIRVMRGHAQWLVGEKVEVDRVDGRTPNQLRPLACSRNTLNRAHGSATWSQGETKVIAAVYGPKAGTKKNENPEKACIEVVWKPKTGQIGKPEKEYEMILKRTSQSICLLTVNSNTTTSVNVSG
ncbi:unnamed protein product [Camellia sinensis]